MRRKDREITNIDEIHDIMSTCKICRLGFYDAGEIYIVPLNFGYTFVNECTDLYFHSAQEGRKIDLLKNHNSVGFEMDSAFSIKEGDEACTYSAYYQSIIGSGYVTFVDDIEEKEKALSLIMYQNTNKQDWTFPIHALHNVCVFKLRITKMSAKANIAK